MAGAPTGRAGVAWTFDRRNGTHPMVTTLRIGRKLKVPSTFQLKHQLLLFWLKNQSAKERAESEAASKDKGASSSSEVDCGNGMLRQQIAEDNDRAQCTYVYTLPSHQGDEGSLGRAVGS